MYFCVKLIIFKLIIFQSDNYRRCSNYSLGDSARQSLQWQSLFHSYDKSHFLCFAAIQC